MSLADTTIPAAPVESVYAAAEATHRPNLYAPDSVP